MHLRGHLLLLAFLILGRPHPELTCGGYLDLNPSRGHVIRLAGDDNSFFTSCIPYSDTGPMEDSLDFAPDIHWWKKKKTALEDTWETLGTHPYDRVHVEQSADGRGMDLVFRSIQANDGGEYSCRATIDGNKETKKFFLYVIEPISFGSTPSIQTVQEGTQKFTLLCNVSGSPMPSIGWNVRGQVIRSGSGKYRVTNDGLIIFNVTREDEGNYKCKATQLDEGISDFKDLVIQLKVQYKPEWPAYQRGEFFGFVSGITNLTCEARAEPPAEFIWLDKHKNQIPFDKVINEDNKSILVVNVTHDDSFGVYTCVAKNQHGHLKKPVVLTEGAKPGIPSIVVNKIDHNSVELTIKEHKAELYLEITSFQLEYKEKSEDWSKAKVIHLDKNNNHYRIDSLHPQTIYNIFAKAQNLAGLSDPSKTISLQTTSAHSVEELVGASMATSYIKSMSSFVTYVIILSVLIIFDYID